LRGTSSQRQDGNFYCEFKLQSDGSALGVALAARAFESLESGAGTLFSELMSNLGLKCCLITKLDCSPRGAVAKNAGEQSCIMADKLPRGNAVQI